MTLPSSAQTNDVRTGAAYAAPALFLFVSGVVALVFEVIWQRHFSLVLGAAAPATAAVLAAYFAGLGIGAVLMGRLSRWVRRPLLVYAGLEMVAGLSGASVPWLLDRMAGTYSSFYDTLLDRPAQLFAAKLCFALMVILIPTIAMGGTLPLLGQWVDQQKRRLGQTAGGLYVLNTAGAALGALAVPFVLLPHFGQQFTLWLCAGLNLTLAALALALNRWSGKSEFPAESPSVRPNNQPPSVGSIRSTNSGGLGFVAFGSGAATFALQVLWNRAFAQVHENSMYSFSTTIALVVAALAIGGQGSRVLLRRGFSPRGVVSGGWIAAGLLLLLAPACFVEWTDGLSYLPAEGGWSAYGLRLIALAIAVLALPMALLGLAFPAVMEAAGASSKGTAAQVLGKLLAWNVAGAVLGSLVAGFLAPGWIDLWSTVIVLGAALSLGGICVFGFSGRVKLVGSGVVVALGCVAVWTHRYPVTRIDPKTGERLIAVSESAYGITAVVEREGSRRLKLNNHYALGGTAAIGDERMQTHLPLLLHPAPRDVLFLGLGTGITAGGALFHRTEKVTAVELVDDVVGFARRHFSAENAGLGDDPRSRLVVDDARNFLRGTQREFDVIIGDLVVPWRAGEGALFTMEQFVAAKRRLRSRGVFCQWLPLFQMSETEFTIVARTFLRVFPAASLWRGDFSPTEPALALIGFADGGRPAPGASQLSWPRDPANPQLATIEAQYMYYVGDVTEAQLDPGEQRLNLEDRPWVELIGPLAHSGADPSRLFVGRKFQGWINQVTQSTSAVGTTFSPEQQRGVEAGRVFAELLLALEHNDREAAELAQQRLSTLLPEATLKHFLH